MHRTLSGRLALVLLGLLALAGALLIAGTVVVTQLYLQEANQRLQEDLAAHIAGDERLMRRGEVNQPALKSLFDKLMSVNPSIEVYLVDGSGRILAYSAPEDAVVRERIDLAPVRTFLEGDASYPLYGDDPRDADGRKVFSAAPVMDAGGLNGYLYVILGGELYQSVMQRLEGSYILRLSLATGLGILVVSLLVGLWAFRRLTRRLRGLTGTVERFEAAGFRGEAPAALAASGRGDEIDRLAGAFDAMSARITEQFDQLREAEASRRELLANVSHDVRTPLASLQGYLETLQLKEDSLAPEERRAYLDTALAHTRRLSRLMTGLLELANLETEEARPSPEPFTVGELAQDVAQKFGLEAERKGITFDFQIPAGLPNVRGDIGLIERVLDNLIKNAVKYTPQGEAVRLHLARSDDGVTVRVSDTGPGIPEEELPHVFERFYRGSRQLPERPEGTGLGLAIAKRILDLHGVSLEVDSRVEEGTSFAFTLPAA